MFKGESQQVQSNIEWRERRLLSLFMMELALSTIRRCRRRRTAEPYTDILAVYILVVASLESFINEICVEAIEIRRQMGSDYEFLQNVMYGDTGRGLEIRQKWYAVIQHLQGRTPVRGSRPWQDFHRLVAIRNLLVHYSGEYEPPEYVPDNLASLLHSQRILTAQRQAHRPLTLSEVVEADFPHWTEMVCSVSMGIWAFNTCVNMIHYFLEAADEETRTDYEVMLRMHRIRRIAASTHRSRNI